MEFPPKQIVKILVEETMSKSSELNMDDEMREMFRNHIVNMERMKTYGEINNWLITYRGLNLEEWVKSL